MECLWGMQRHWQPDGYCHQQDPAIFYIHLPAHDGLPDYPVHGARFLEKYAEVYLGGEAESLVLFIRYPGYRKLSYRLQKKVLTDSTD